jgi:muramoyltetrapeptide carboxypeptidase
MTFAAGVPTRGRALRPGDRVRVVSPSFPALAIIAERRQRAERALHELELRVDYGANAFKVWGHLAGSPQERADDINAAFCDESVSAILCALGGSDCLDLLHRLDYDAIARHPKLFIGHSSNLTLLLALLARSRLITFYGPSFVNLFGEFPAPLADNVAGFRAACMRSEPLVLRPMARRTDVLPGWWVDPNEATRRELNLNGGWRWLKSGAARGPLVGGYLPYLLDIIDTPWMPPLDGAILFTDMMAMNSVLVDAMLGELARNGVLGRLAGLVVGVPARYAAPPWMSALDEVILKWSPHVTGPVLADADCGHTDPLWTIPIGTWADLRSDDDSFWCEPGTVSAR